MLLPHGAGDGVWRLVADWLTTSYDVTMPVFSDLNNSFGQYGSLVKACLPMPCAVLEHERDKGPQLMQCHCTTGSGSHSETKSGEDKQNVS